MSTTFTLDEVIAAAQKRYKKKITIEDASEIMANPTLETAVVHCLLVSSMWDSPTGNPLDEDNLVEEETREQKIDKAIRPTVISQIKTGKNAESNMYTAIRLMSHMRKLDMSEADGYRAIKRMCDDGLIRKVQVFGRRAGVRYELFTKEST